MIGEQTPEQHAQQRVLVELASWRAARSSERRDESAAHSRIYSSRAREQKGNVIPLGSDCPPEPPRAA